MHFSNELRNTFKYTEVHKRSLKVYKRADLVLLVRVGPAELILKIVNVCAISCSRALSLSTWFLRVAWTFQMHIHAITIFNTFIHSKFLNFINVWIILCYDFMLCWCTLLFAIFLWISNASPANKMKRLNIYIYIVYEKWIRLNSST